MLESVCLSEKCKANRVRFKLDHSIKCHKYSWKSVTSRMIRKSFGLSHICIEFVRLDAPWDGSFRKSIAYV